MIDAAELTELSGVRVGGELARLCDLAAEALGNVGPLLRELRGRRGLTLEAAAGQIGLSAGTLSTFESGARHPNPEHLKYIARWARAAYAGAEG